MIIAISLWDELVNSTVITNLSVHVMGIYRNAFNIKIASIHFSIAYITWTTAKACLITPN